jgi:hypothetical protein
MTEPVLILPFVPDLLAQIGRRRVIVRTASPAVDEIARISGKHNRLDCIRLEFPGPLTDLPFSDSWIGIPVVACVQSIGEIARLAEKLPLLQSLSLQVYFYSEIPGSYRAARILSSLMIASGIVLAKNNIDWTLLDDLMHYAVYGKVKHAPIEPFEYMISHYSPTGLTDFQTIYLENPSQFLHCNENGELALSRAALLKNDFVATLKELDTFLADGRYQNLITRKADFFFLQDPECLSCPAWRVCLGTFRNGGKDMQGCKEFSSDLMEAAEYAQEREKKNPTLWQP